MVITEGNKVQHLPEGSDTCSRGEKYYWRMKIKKVDEEAMMEAGHRRDVVAIATDGKKKNSSRNRAKMGFHYRRIKKKVEKK